MLRLRRTAWSLAVIEEWKYVDKNTNINRSGFPLQIGLAHAIDASSQEHGWKVLHQEHGWKHSYTGESGFIDLVVENQYKTVILNIECKRPQEATWQFLLPDGANVHHPLFHVKQSLLSLFLPGWQMNDKHPQRIPRWPLSASYG